MAKACTLEIIGAGGGFILHRPDGGFRRLKNDPDGGWRLADGADDLTAKVGFDADHVEFFVDGDRYSMPLGILPKR